MEESLCVNNYGTQGELNWINMPLSMSRRAVAFLLGKILSAQYGMLRVLETSRAHWCTAEALEMSCAALSD